MKQKLRNSMGYLVVLLLAFVAYIAIGGSIEPITPPGVPTMRTLDEVYSAASSAPTDDLLPDIADVRGAKAIHMRLRGETQGWIQGSCTAAGREDTIGVIGFSHEVVSPRDAASGLPTGKRQHKPVTITKRIDKSTPLLFNVLVNNENITDLTLRFYQKSQSGAAMNYYEIRLTNASVAGIKQIDTEREEISFCYQKIEWIFVDGGITAEDDWEAPNV